MTITIQLLIHFYYYNIFIILWYFYKLFIYFDIFFYHFKAYSSSFKNDGYPVLASNLYHSLESDTTLFEYLPLNNSSIGITAILLLTCPTVNPEKPAIEAWAAFYANYAHIILSWGLAGTVLIIYVGSIYFKVIAMSLDLQYFVNSSLTITPTS